MWKLCVEQKRISVHTGYEVNEEIVFNFEEGVKAIEIAETLLKSGSNITITITYEKEKEHE